MGQNWSPCTPTTLDLDQGLSGNVVSVVNFGARYGFWPFFKWPP